MTNNKFLCNAIAAVMITLFAAPAFSAINPKDDGIKGKEVGTPIRVFKGGKWVWDICIGPGPCGPGQIKIAKSAEQEACEANPKLCDLTRPLASAEREACEANPKLCSLTRPLASKLQMASLDPNAGQEDLRRDSSIALGKQNGPKIEIVCDNTREKCDPGQQMGGGPKKNEGQQMGPKFKEFMKGIDKMVLKGIGW